MTETVFSTASEVAARFNVELAKKLENPGKLPGTTSGFAKLNDLTNGFQPGQFIVIASRPRCGKTSLALGMAYSIALEDKKPVGFLSLEMTETQLWLRFVSGLTGINSQTIQTGELNDEQVEEIRTASNEAAKLPLYFAEAATGINTIPAIEQQAMLFAAESGQGFGCIFIDMMKHLRPIEARNEEEIPKITELTRELKRLAIRLNIPIIALHHMNRGVEGRAVKRPTLADLKGCGSIEEDADVVMFIHREELYDAETSRRGEADLYVEKNRFGPEGKVELLFDASCTWFSAKPDFSPPVAGTGKYASPAMKAHYAPKDD